MYAAWLKDNQSVHKSWDIYFSTGQFTSPDILSISPKTPLALYTDTHNGSLSLKVAQLVRAHQVKGHFHSKLDPLGIHSFESDGTVPTNELSLETFGLTEADLDKEVDVSSKGIKGFQDPSRGSIQLRKLVQRLKETYTSTVGAEYMHIPSTEKCNFIRSRLETPETVSLSKADKLVLLDRLTWADHFEKFCSTRYPTAKRFGVEGAEAIIPGLKFLLDHAATQGVSSSVIGMPHRGRLNVLASVIRKPLEQIFSEFSGGGDEGAWGGSGDVKYHLGASHDREVKGGYKIHLSLVANPSHLEAVNPGVLGKTKAKQFVEDDPEMAKILPILLHGDASFSGQGIIYETMGLSLLDDYKVGGTVHVVLNNQIGFTTNPVESRSSAYCTDIAKAFNAPIFHVNAEDCEAVVKVFRIAAEWRHLFKTDVVVDLIGYRKYGHNEIDEPMFTQPQMYKKIAQMRPVLESYAAKLVKEGVVTAQEVKSISDRVNGEISKKFDLAKTHQSKPDDWFHGKWAGISRVGDNTSEATAVVRSELESIGKALVAIPEDFHVHKRLAMVLSAKKAALDAGQHIDWGTAEALAFGTLLKQGFHVRLSGQDVERGTFSHRHAVIHDQETPKDEVFIPLEHISKDQATFTACNSSLSEFGVLGFDMGYCLENPNQLVLWEAQFGDFANGAQIIFDQFLSAGETKWLRQCGLVVLLPHGYEGQGPEHSSCRLERFLQCVDEDEDTFPSPDESQTRKINWQVMNLTTPANYFHALRRQVCRNYRKPLIIATPKSLLRHKKAVSSFDDMSIGSEFQPFISDPYVQAGNNVRRVVLCAGKVYYDLLAYREANKVNDVVISRVEQLAPFPFVQVLQEMKNNPNAEIVWCQEEPKNMGGWNYVKPRIETALRDHNNMRPKYAGRKASASTATGFGTSHKKEQEALIEAAMN